MSIIHVLNDETINKIAAGEVVERPANVVKELVENAIDAGADSITVEIKDGGIGFIRVTDNGAGISAEDIPKAFLRHATSKIDSIDDLNTIRSMGFRGEALSSIAAVAQVELMTKVRDEIIGQFYAIEGSKEVERKEIGVPGGTTIIIRNLFFNTPARLKFLKSASTEGSYVGEVMHHLALANPSVSIKFINGGSVRFHTSGSGDVKELIYRLFGKESAEAVIPMNNETAGIKISGFLGKPEIARNTRNFENYFLNGRYVKSDIVSKALEDGYKEYMMQHKFPFCVMYIEMDPKNADINVHPGKLQVRFKDEELVSDVVSSAVSSTLRVKEMIPETVFEKPAEEELPAPNTEPFEQERKQVQWKENNIDIDRILGKTVPGKEPYPETPVNTETKNVIKRSDAIIVNTAVQMEMFEDRLLSTEAVSEYEIVGQIFDTFWLFTYKDKLLMMDQHAAHEKVKYERLVAQMKNKSVAKQMLAPAIVITLSPSELATVKEYIDNFKEIGYEIDEFGGFDISLRAVPMDLYGKEPKELFLDILDELSEGRVNGIPEVINAKLASMACKAAVKGNMSMSEPEVKELLKELLTLDNPYNCPHGRPTIITMTRTEIEKRFKRIV